MGLISVKKKGGSVGQGQLQAFEGTMEKTTKGCAQTNNWKVTPDIPSIIKIISLFTLPFTGGLRCSCLIIIKHWQMLSGFFSKHPTESQTSFATTQYKLYDSRQWKVQRKTVFGDVHWQVKWCPCSMWHKLYFTSSLSVMNSLHEQNWSTVHNPA